MSIILENVHFIYQSEAVEAVQALKNINVIINEGEFVGIIGHTGSGKSTLVQHFNGLLKPTTGTVSIDGLVTTERKIALREIRKKVGLVFQYPEHQLFEETVFADIAFGPRNLGLTSAQVEQRVKKALQMVQLPLEKYAQLSPFNLSGGEKRRVAIAGVLALEPKYLILDEPTAGLDPRGRDEILRQIRALHQAGITVILVSHSMDDVARLTERLLVMHQGTIIFDEPTRQVFAYYEQLRKIGLDIPTVAKLMYELHRRGWSIRQDLFTVEEAYREILRIWKEEKTYA
ncbi:MAG TPA: energy-coupling factor transporter ATPase [Clostridia bacterium]|jgi:energy-coupling factor transport system ATP-binding protein|nr:energy-coupling factor transporter ATPase [Clostridia bacterium]